MIQPDPLAMLAGTVAFLAVLVVTMAVTAVRRRRRPVTVEAAAGTRRERRIAG